MGRGGRFIFWWGAEGLLATTVAMMLTAVEVGEVERLRRAELSQATQVAKPGELKPKPCRIEECGGWWYKVDVWECTAAHNLRGLR